jgi:hypothetical protein
MSERRNESRAGGQNAEGRQSAKTGPGRRAPQEKTDGTVQQRPDRYLVALRPPRLLPPGVNPTIAQPAALFDWLAKLPDVHVIRRLRQVQAPGVPACPEIAVVEMEWERAVALGSSVEVLVEPDVPLSYADPNPIVNPFALPDPGVVVPLSDALSVPFVVRDADGAPLDGADVCLLGRS